MAKRITVAGPVEGRWSLPQGWSWRRARDFAKIVGGSTPKNAADPSNYSDDGTPWLTPADLSGYSRPTIGGGRRNLAGHVVNRSALLPTGAVLISSRAPVGYCAVASNPMVTNQGFRSLILSDDLDPFFIRYYVLFSRKYLEDHASGTTFKELSGSALGDLVFPVPPLDAQQRIVSRIDELFAEIDDGEVALARARDDLATWRKALLKAAVTGELTADWRAASSLPETGADLLARTLVERRARWDEEPRNKSKRYGSPTPPNLVSLPNLPQTWTWATVDQLSTRVTKGSSPGWQGFDYQEDGILFVRSQNVGWGKLLLEERVYLDAAFNAIESKAIIQQGDVLLNIVGASIGRACKADIRLSGANSNQAVAGIRPVNSTLSDWIVAWLVSPPGQAAVFANVVETARANLSLEQVRAIPVPLPPECERDAALATYQQSIEAQEAMVADVKETADAASTLRQSILAAAFRGELA
jgi:type I restriction enzyme S subunit